MKIIFFGEDKFSIPALEALLEAGHAVPLWITTQANPANDFLRRQAGMLGIPLLALRSMGDPGLAARLASLSADLFLLIHFNRILPPEIFTLPSRGAINLHPSLLPAYRGQTPQQWAIIHGEKEIGVTTHFVEEAVDAGDIILQERFAVEETLYISELQQLLFQNYKRIIGETMQRIATPGFVPQKQPAFTGNIYPKVNPANTALHDGNTAREVYDRIRALSFPYFGAPYRHYRLFRGEIMPPDKAREIRERYRQPGFYTDTEWGIVFIAKDGALEIDWYEEKS